MAVRLPDTLEGRGLLGRLGREIVEFLSYRTAYTWSAQQAPAPARKPAAGSEGTLFSQDQA
jgi:hypothetical protein